MTKTTATKHLAIQTEDHPLSYIKFKGTIPKGEYGAGKMEIWDKGQYGVKGSFRSGLKTGHLELWFEGDRVHGGYALHRMKNKSWLLVKMKKKEADSSARKSKTKKKR